MLADIVKLARRVYKEKPSTKNSISAYLINMAVRLKPMRGVLKDTGTIYLHCDPTASHYLKMLMDAIFGAKNFRNECLWLYAGGGIPKKDFPRKHDVILRYTKSKNCTFNVTYKPYGIHAKSGRRATDRGGTRSVEYNPKGTPLNNWWSDIKPLINWHEERIGYPTQKPLNLLERIISTSSNKGDVVMDPFCGCGTTVHAAESLGRKWIGIDISVFSAGLVRNRLYTTFDKLKKKNRITVVGSPYTIEDAVQLAKDNKFEFEKWVCGEIGASGMFHSPGERGADGGVDGVIPFYYSESGEKAKTGSCIVQVKGGRVSPDNVKALASTVRHFDADCGVFVCFDKYMRTVNNNREKRRIKEYQGGFDFIQGLSVEQLINGEKPKLPFYSGGTKHNPKQTELFPNVSKM